MELALALKKRLNDKKKNLKITIVTGKNGILSSFPAKTKKISLKALKEASIKLLENKEVIQVKKDKLIMSDGTVLNIDKSILSTNAMAPKWIKNSDIQLNEESFIVVNNAFQTNHNFIFAAGDIVDFNNENLKIEIKDYYFSNVVAKSSKTMIECNNAKTNLKSTGTEG